MPDRNDQRGELSGEATITVTGTARVTGVKAIRVTVLIVVRGEVRDALHRS